MSKHASSRRVWLRRKVLESRDLRSLRSAFRAARIGVKPQTILNATREVSEILLRLRDYQSAVPNDEERLRILYGVPVDRDEIWDIRADAFITLSIGKSSPAIDVAFTNKLIRQRPKKRAAVDAVVRLHLGTSAWRPGKTDTLENLTNTIMKVHKVMHIVYGDSADAHEHFMSDPNYFVLDVHMNNDPKLFELLRILSIRLRELQLVEMAESQKRATSGSMA